MTALERLNYFVIQLLDKSSTDKKPVSMILEPLMSKALTGLTDVITDEESSSAQRLSACELLLTTWQRCVKVEIQTDRTAALAAKAKAMSDAARAERSRIKLEGKKTDLAIAAKRRRMQ